MLFPEKEGERQGLWKLSGFFLNCGVPLKANFWDQVKDLEGMDCEALTLNTQGSLFLL